jgi:formylglycine-generating enzyme required for sulfatase activity
MPFRPKPNEELKIDHQIYRIVEHPAAPGIAYGQSGRRGTVYQLLDQAGDAWALKVFQPQYREPRLAGQAEQIRAFASLPGLIVGDRKVLTSTQNVELIRKHMDLAYAVLMPWVPGQTWMEMVFTKQALISDQSYRIAQTLLRTLTRMEELGIAHCDLSGSNIIIGSGESIELVDLEELFTPGLTRPKALPGGSPGYAHRMAPEGLWNENADRFSGAILLAEILGWSDERVRKNAWGEGYFNPVEMQTNCERFHLLKDVLKNRWGDATAALYEGAWFSDLLSLCPTFTEWLAALPETWEETSLDVIGEDKTDNVEFHQPDPAEATVPSVKVEPVIPTERGSGWICSECEREVPFGMFICPYCEIGVRPTRRAMLEDYPTREVEEETVTTDVDREVDSPPYKVEFSNGLLNIQWRGKIFKFQAWVFGVIGVAIFIFALVFGNRGESAEKWTPEAIVINEDPTSEATELEIEELGTSAGLVATQAVKTAMAELTLEAQRHSSSEVIVETPVLSTSTPTPADTATPLPHPGEVSLNDIDGAELVYIPAGDFLMGSDYAMDPYIWGGEVPAHDVYVDGFWIYRHEVTNAMYRDCVSEGDCQRTYETGMYLGVNYYSNSEYSNYPVVQVEWYQAKDYCEWAGGRLPTEAEWEKAARGEDGRLFPWGNETPTLNLINLCDELCPHEEHREEWNDGYPLSSPVGSFPRGDSPYGAFDMAGNVWEWVSDWFQSDYYTVSPNKNPKGPSSGESKVVRGGSWYNMTDGVRTVSRTGIDPHDLRESVGFRCAVDAP